MSLDFLKETEEFKRLFKAIRRGEKGLKVTGLVEASKPYFLSTLALESKKRIVFIQPSSFPLSEIEEQCRFYLAQLSSDLSLSSLPSLSENPYQEIFPSLDSVSSRMKFFYNLINNSASLVATHIFGLLKPFPNPQNLKRLFLNLEKGETFERDQILSILDEYGYTREDLINSHGEYAWRGGIVDVFSPWQPLPYRIEFSGDEIPLSGSFQVHLNFSRNGRNRLEAERKYAI
jgi:transcription-repair coupling factor (superfamily II helicase)